MTTTVPKSLLGAAGGAVTGFLVGGGNPIGALLGAAAGYLGGAHLDSQTAGSSSAPLGPTVGVPVTTSSAAPPIAPDDNAWLLAGHAAMTAAGTAPPEVPTSPDGSEAYPFVAPVTQTYGPKGVWVTKMVQGVQEWGVYEKPLNVLGQTVYAYVKKKP
jgi:hypothetical protein